MCMCAVSSDDREFWIECKRFAFKRHDEINAEPTKDAKVR
jgi:hypothetical protein